MSRGIRKARRRKKSPVEEFPPLPKDYKIEWGKDIFPLNLTSARIRTLNEKPVYIAYQTGSDQEFLQNHPTYNPDAVLRLRDAIYNMKDKVHKLSGDIICVYFEWNLKTWIAEHKEINFYPNAVMQKTNRKWCYELTPEYIRWLKHSGFGQMTFCEPYRD